MGLLDSIRKMRDSFRESLSEAREESQVAAFKNSKSTDEYVTMTIMGDSELETMTRAGWDLVRQFPRNEHDLLKDIAPAQYLVRRKREDLGQSLGL